MEWLTPSPKPPPKRTVLIGTRRIPLDQFKKSKKYKGAELEIPVKLSLKEGEENQLMLPYMNR